MENNNFVETLKVTWESLVTGFGTPSSGAVSVEDAGLIIFGLLCIVVTRRYLVTLASARTLQPAAAHELQQTLQHALRPAAAPLSAPLHAGAAPGAATTSGNASRAA